MGLIARIFLTIICLLFSFYSFRMARKEQKNEPGISTPEIKKRHEIKLVGNVGGILFLLPLISCWFPKWANAHNWNSIYAGILLIIFAFYGMRIGKDKDKEENSQI